MRWVEEDGSARLVDKRKGETVAGDWLAGVSSTSRGCFKVFEGEVGWGGGLGCGRSHFRSRCGIVREVLVDGTSISHLFRISWQQP